MLSRRAALQGGTSVAAAITATGVAAASPYEPLLDLWRERERILEALDNRPEEEGPSHDDLMDAWTVAEVAIVEAEPTTFAGALVQLEQVARWADGGRPYAGMEAVTRLVEILPERIERLAGRAER